LPTSIFAVAKSNITTGLGQIISATNSGGGILSIYRVGNAFRYARNDGTTGKTADGLSPNTNWNIHSIVTNGTTASVWISGAIGSNGVDVNVNSLAAIDRVGIGFSGVAANTLNGDIAEIIVFPTALTATNRQSIERYLSNKYAIALA
jgi:hypothetical protein